MINRILFILPGQRRRARKNREEFVKKMSLDTEYNREVPSSYAGNVSSMIYKDSILVKGMIYCAQCGVKINRKMKKCPSCGDSTDDESTSLHKA